MKKTVLYRNGYKFIYNGTDTKFTRELLGIS